jgi:hypothetical protein
MVILLLVCMLVGVVGASSASEPWDVMSDTWVAADALGRKLPGYEECGPPRNGRFVGIFYFIWHGQHGTGGPYDITKILADNPSDPKWGPPGAFHHWGEPELGYYLSDDEYVIRRHARMLSDAGVDMIAFDVTNGFTYDNVYMKLLKVYQEMRKNGERTPQVTFLTNSSHDVVVKRLYDNLYSKGLYSDLWFQWQGKPLMMSKPDGLPEEIRNFFTFRQSWAWSNTDWFGDGKDKWPWLDHTPQKPGWHTPGVPEEVPVAVAQHPTTNIGRSYRNGKQPEPKNFRTAEGVYFAEQWEHALSVDPQIVFITGWNEWVAQRFLSNGRSTMLGRVLPEGETYFVDEYNQEYSRDIEPMKGGHTDNYYYQMISYIRRYKGVRPPEPASAQKTIVIDGKFSDWLDVRPEFRDHVGDTEHRNSIGWGNAGIYINKTGRNDFVRLKVARDNRNVYFYAETRENITPYTERNWMLLFIDTDQDPSTGWNGYDYLVNASVPDAKTTTVKKNLGGWKWSEGIRVPYRVAGNKMEIAIPRSVLELPANGDFAFDFHWADNIQKTDDIVEFAMSGDSAPDRRFNYRYLTKRAPNKK